MLKKEFNDMLDNMSYEQQKDLMKKIQNDDFQSYDDSCNVIEVVVDAVINAVGTLVKMIIK